MARPLRFQYSGAVYHVMARGDGGKVKFRIPHSSGFKEILELPGHSYPTLKLFLLVKKN
jgi:hypothetical protein